MTDEELDEAIRKFRDAVSDLSDVLRNEITPAVTAFISECAERGVEITGAVKEGTHGDALFPEAPEE